MPMRRTGCRSQCCSKRRLKVERSKRIEVRRVRQSLGARHGLKSGISKRERHGAGIQAGIAQAFGALLAEAAQHRFERRAIARIRSKRMTMGDRFWFGINKEFVGILPARFPLERRAPSSKEFFQPLLRNKGELANGFDSRCTQGRFRHTADSRNSAHAKRSEKLALGASRNPHQSARFGLIRCNFGNKSRASETGGAGQSCRRADFGQ